MNREQRIIARGENSNHCHVITGDVTITKKSGDIFIEVGEDSNAVLKHLLESDWLKGTETWTKEHENIPLEKGTYKYIPQLEYSPYDDIIKRVQD